jgi:hypothetical protein
MLAVHARVRLHCTSRLHQQQRHREAQLVRAELARRRRSLTRLCCRCVHRMPPPPLRALHVISAAAPCVWRVQLADRLHNMRTLRYMSPEKQRKISR